MPEAICDTSPLQYLHQIGLLPMLPALVKSVLIPPAVVEELAEGKARGIDVPEVGTLPWVSVRTPKSISALPLVRDLGPGEAEVLMLAIEIPDSIVMADDQVARQVAAVIRRPVKGTLGLLLDAKKRRLVQSVKPYLDQLQQLRFRLAPVTRQAILEMANEQD